MLIFLQYFHTLYFIVTCLSCVLLFLCIHFFCSLTLDSVLYRPLGCSLHLIKRNYTKVPIKRISGLTTSRCSVCVCLKYGTVRFYVSIIFKKMPMIYGYTSLSRKAILSTDFQVSHKKLRFASRQI